MYQEDIKYIQELESRLGDSRFAAVSHVIDRSRELLQESPSAFAKEAIACIVAGRPMPVSQESENTRSTVEIAISDACRYVEDPNTISVITASVYNSLQYHYPMFEYGNADTSQHPRIRILVRYILKLIGR